MTPSDIDVVLKDATERLKRADFDGAYSLLHPYTSNLASSEQVEALYLCAVAKRYNKAPQQALGLLHRLLGECPEHARALQECGYCYLSLGKQGDAAKAFFDATTLNPALVASWQQLQSVYSVIGDEKSIAFAKDNLTFWRSLPPPLLGSAQLLFDGKSSQADRVCRRFLQQHKHHPDGLYLLGLIGVKMGQYIEAEFVLESALSINPAHLRCRYEYGMLLNRLGKYQKAKENASMLLARQPDNLNFQVLLGLSNVGIGDYQDGIDCLNQVVEAEPQRASVWLQLGHAYKNIGDIEAAIIAYQTAYTHRPHYGDAYWSLTNTKTYSLSEDELDSAVRILDTTGLVDEDYVHFCFAIAKTYEDKKDYETAFNYYQRGNARQYKVSQYRPDMTSKAVDDHCRFFSAERFASMQGVGDDSGDPIFVVGLPRAGSTLIEQILASHSNIDGTMELQNILALAARLSQGSSQGLTYPDMLTTLDPEYFARFGAQYLEQTRQYRGTGRFFIDKMPNNFMHIGLIKLILPNAKIIDARRDPMACCFSGYKQLFAEGQAFSYDLSALGQYYRDYERMMAHWDKVLPGHVLRVNHEDVVDDLEGQVKRLLAFIGVPFEPTCIDFHKTKRAINTPSAQQVRQPIYRSGLNQWRHFEPFLAPLKRALEQA